MTNPFTLVTASSLINKPYETQWLIKGHMELNTIGMLFGEPACAKSFIAMDIAFCVSSGHDWNGNNTEQGKVVYIAGEGHIGIGKRIKALEQKYCIATSNLFFSETAASLSSQEGVNEVQKSIDNTCPNPTLIIIDTLNCNLGSGDENNARDFALFKNLVRDNLMTSGAAVVIVHHSGHGSSNRSRGSSAIKGAMDIEYQITKKDDLVTMKCTKAKDFIEPEPVSFKLIPEAIPGWFDDDGSPVESAILEPTTYTAPTKATGGSISKNDTLILKSLTDSISKKGTLATKEQTDAYPELVGKKHIHVDDWKAEACQQLSQKNGGSNKPDSNLKAFGRAQKNLLNLGKIATEDNHYWLKAS